MKDFIGLDGTEDEQLERLKFWWKENSTAIIAGIAIAVVATFSWKGYKDYQHTYQLEARTLYLKIIEEPSQANFKNMQDEYSNSSYYPYVQLLIAKEYYKNKKYIKALSLLNEVKNIDYDFLGHIARLKIATINLDQNKYQEALDVLDEVESEGTFIGNYESLRGDISFLKNDLASAKIHYQKAIDNIVNNKEKAVVQLKLIDLK